MQASMKEELKNIKVEYQRNAGRMENYILGSEGKLKKDLSRVDQHSYSEQELENGILSRKQEFAKNSHINVEETRKNREDETQIIAEDSIYKIKEEK